MSEFEKAENLYELLAQRRLRQILTSLDSPKKLTDIVKETGLTESQLYYGIGKLKEEEVVKYNQKSRRWNLTSYGEISLADIQDFIKKSILEKKSIYTQINTDLIPREFRNIVRLLNDKCTLIKGVPRVNEKARDMLRESRKVVQVIVDNTAGDDLSKPIIRKIKRGLKFHLVARFDSDPKNRRGLFKAGAKLKKAKDEDIFIGILIVDNSQVAILFPRELGTLNWHFGFFSREKEVLKWANEVFDYIWERSEPLPKNQMARK